MSVNEIAHYNTIFDSSTCVKKGFCPISEQNLDSGSLSGSHSLYFEQHGSGPEKILFIMGMNNPSVFWEDQVRHFSRLDRYTVLVFDNRGVGHSTFPNGPFSTNAMARDTMCLLEYIGWTKDRDLHIVGTSLGGMIALELATLIPNQIVSLTLCATTAGGYFWQNFPSWRAMFSIPRLFTIKDPEIRAPIIQALLFPQSWREEKATDDAEGRTNSEVQAESFIRRVQAAPVQNPSAALSQMRAALAHHVSADRLQQISKSIPKVVILVGDKDYMVEVRNSTHLKAHMPEAELIQWERTGHVMQVQWPDRFNKLLERVIEEGRNKSTSGNK